MCRGVYRAVAEIDFKGQTHELKKYLNLVEVISDSEYGKKHLVKMDVFENNWYSISLDDQNSLEGSIVEDFNLMDPEFIDTDDKIREPVLDEKHAEALMNSGDRIFSSGRFSDKLNEFIRFFEAKESINRIKSEQD